MKRWVREDAVVDMVFVSGAVLLAGGLWVISPVAAVLFAGLLLMSVAATLRIRR